LLQSYVSDRVFHIASPLRIEFDGALYRIASRGNPKEPIFIADTNCVLVS